jgi:hypothetical protein
LREAPRSGENAAVVCEQISILSIPFHPPGTDVPLPPRVNVMPQFDFTTRRGRRRLAKEIHRMNIVTYGRASFGVTAISEELEMIADGRIDLWPTFGAPSWFSSVVIIWPRAKGEVVWGELECKYPGCSSWTKVALPEVMFLPGIAWGPGGGLLDAWAIRYAGPPGAVCPAHRHWFIPMLPPG